MGQRFAGFEPWQTYVLTSHEGFEKLYGRRADKIRKLYNGMIPCYLYQFFKPAAARQNEARTGYKKGNEHHGKPNQNKRRY
jgi:putative N6-adenine-specific DNA methylase